MRSTLIPVCALLLGAPLLAQQPASRPSFPGVPIPARGPCPSVVTKLVQRKQLLVGEYRLTTRRPAVVDGDTIRVEGLDASLRLVGIDTEEVFHDAGRRALAARDWREYVRTMYAGTDPARPPKYATPLGEAAKDFARRFFSGLRNVRLEYDDPHRRRGYFNRHLVHVLAMKDGRWINFNVEIVRQGLSPYFVKYGRCARYHAAMLEAEKEARDYQRGLWARRPAYACYGDYPLRLRWWQDRDRELMLVKELRKSRRDLLVLGEDADWKTLLGSDGRRVTIAGTPGRFLERGRTGLQMIAHRNGNDFVIAGPVEQVRKLGLRRHAGHYVLVEGRVSLYKGRPQFRIEQVAGVRPLSR